MPVVGAIVMAHPSRADMAGELARRIGGDTSVVWDQSNNEWDTGRNAWLAGTGIYGITHWAVIQDDAIVTTNLIGQITAALHHVPPGNPLSLYLGQKRPYADMVNWLARKAIESDPPFIVLNRLHWGVGVVVPAAQIDDMIDYCDGRGDSRYDIRLSKWFEHTGRQVYYTWPSLVDHRQVKSVLGNKREGRRAHRFIGDGQWEDTAEEAACDEDFWTGRPIGVSKSTSKRLP